MLQSSTLLHLRFLFSLFLMPVYWFALSQAHTIHIANAVLIFIVLHALVYPASNGYNSYMDQDTESIGGIEKPVPVPRQMLYVTYIMDALALAASLFIHLHVATLLLIYIIASRLYSNRRVRLKKYAITGYLTVVICQGALVYCIVICSVDAAASMNHTWMPPMIASLLIGGTYPLTQVYQHKQDKKDGVTTISYLLGIKGTFVFCAVMLLLAALALSYYFVTSNQLTSLFIYFTAMLPVGIYFTKWFIMVDKDVLNANYKNLMKMNYVASVCSSAAFIGILLVKNW